MGSIQGEVWKKTKVGEKTKEIRRKDVSEFHSPFVVAHTVRTLSHQATSLFAWQFRDYNVNPSRVFQPFGRGGFSGGILCTHPMRTLVDETVVCPFFRTQHCEASVEKRRLLLLLFLYFTSPYEQTRLPSHRGYWPTALTIWWKCLKCVWRRKERKRRWNERKENSRY